MNGPYGGLDYVGQRIGCALVQVGADFIFDRSTQQFSRLRSKNTAKDGAYLDSVVLSARRLGAAPQSFGFYSGLKSSITCASTQKKLADPFL